jgi:TetR/AcrR family transcriptional regulator, ethionamide resistance regulator
MAKIINHLFGDNRKQQRQMRARLVSSSVELVSIKPASEITIKELTEQAQVSKAAFYKCFRSLEDLLNVSGKKAGQELLKPINAVGSTIPNIALRMATKTRIAIRLLTGIPFLGRLLLKTEWPFGDVQHKGYRDIQKDVEEGIKQGCFSDMPLEIGVNLVISTLRVSVQEILNSTQTQEYETQVIYSLLLSLGVDTKAADDISKIPFDQLPSLTKNGLVGRIFTSAR